MNKYPVYGFEKAYFESIKKEIEKYSQNIYFDEFDNLIVCPEKITADTILIGIEASENAFLINEILDNGLVKFSAYKEPDKSIINQRVEAYNKTGFIFGDEKDYKIDFGYSNAKEVSSFLKKCDVIYIKPEINDCGDAVFTNMKCYLLKNIMLDLIKTNKNVVFAFIREGKKGAYALGKNLKINNAYFISLVEDTKGCFIRKEGDYISNMKIEGDNICVLKKEESLAGSYFLAGGSSNTIGIALGYQDLKNGIYKVLKEDIGKLNDLFNRD
jgi:hypothetical protein